MTYIDFLIQHSFPEEVILIAEGKVNVPRFTVSAPADLIYGFPPGLIPLWSNSSWPGYIGLMTQWFGDTRHYFVKFYVECHSFTEIARDIEQLKVWMTFDFLCNVPDADEVGRFAESIGLCRGDELEDMFAKCQTVHDLIQIPCMNSAPPHGIMDKSRAIGANQSEDISHIYELIEQRDYHSAWQSLNSRPFKHETVVGILDALAPHSMDTKRFNDLIQCWLHARNMPQRVYPGSDLAK